MSANNGVIRIGKKGIVKFAFGEDGAPFEVDVVVAFQEWINIDAGFRLIAGPDVPQEDVGTIPTGDMPGYHRAAVEFAHGLMAEGNGEPTTAEALDFIARLREQYDELADFFRPRRREKDASPDTTAPALRFSVEGDASPSSTKSSSN